MNGSSYVKIPLRSSGILNVENDEKFCFMWSKLASFDPCSDSHRNRISNYVEHFFEKSLPGFNFSNGFKCGDSYNFEKLKTLSIIMFEPSFYQDQTK